MWTGVHVHMILIKLQMMWKLLTASMIRLDWRMCNWIVLNQQAAFTSPVSLWVSVTALLSAPAFNSPQSTVQMHFLKIEYLFFFILFCSLNSLACTKTKGFLQTESQKKKHSVKYLLRVKLMWFGGDSCDMSAGVATEACTASSATRSRTIATWRRPDILPCQHRATHPWTNDKNPGTQPSPFSPHLLEAALVTLETDGSAPRTPLYRLVIPHRWMKWVEKWNFDVNECVWGCFCTLERVPCTDLRRVPDSESTSALGCHIWPSSARTRCCSFCRQSHKPSRSTGGKWWRWHQPKRMFVTTSHVKIVKILGHSEFGVFILITVKAKQ